MSPVPEHQGLLRAGLLGSLMIHLALAFLPWGGLVEGDGEEPSGDGSFEVSMMPGVAGGAEVPGEQAPVPAPADEAVSEPEQAVNDPELLEPEEVEPAPEDPVVEAPPPSGLGAPAAGDATPQGGGATAPGEASEGGSGAGVEAPPAAYSPPRLLAGALPIDPDDSEKLDVPPEIPVRLRIGEDGQVKEIVPSNPDLPPQVMEALERSARAMKFIPARRGDSLVEAWFHMTFVYRK